MKHNKAYIAQAPYVYTRSSVFHMMRDVIIALIPAVAAAVWYYGSDALWRILFSAALSVILETVYEKLMHHPVSAGDLSAVVSGIILALCLPVTIPYWMIAVGTFISMVVVKQLFGGLGHNFANPALVALLTLQISFPSAMNEWTGPTALELFRLNADVPSNLSMLFSFRNGPMGHCCAFAIILGGLYLLIRKIISPLITGGMLLSAAVFILLAGYDPIFQLLAGGILFCAVFMANDPVTSPATRLGCLIYAILCGAMAVFFRFYTSESDGYSYALLFCNILVPYIDRFTRTRTFSQTKGGQKK